MTNQLLSHLPSSDIDLYAHLPRSVKDEAAAWFEMISEVQAATNGGRTLVLKKFAARLGKSVAQCTRKYYEFASGNDLYPAGDWRALINRKKAGPAWWDSGDPTSVVHLPAKFLDFWRGLCEDNQRAKCETQHRALLRQWKRWLDGDPSAAIPGYDSAPQPDPNGRPDSDISLAPPRGWSYRNLMRHKPVKVEMVIATQGTSAALKLLPPVPRTRVGARFLEYVFFDDVWLDRKCVVNGYRDPARILQLGCLDHATGVYLKFGQRPELPSDGDGDPSGRTRKERLKERDMKWLVASLLEDYGYPADYDMHLIVERGTATLREPDARALHDLSGGRIKVCRTSMEGRLVLSWEERSTGNPRGKGPLESWHNLLHNESGSLPGQMGKDREHAPAELFGREKEAVNLHTAALVLSDEQRSRLRLPFPTKAEAHLQTVEIINRINSRHDHDIDGFESTLLWRLRGTQMEWRPEGELASLPQEMQQHLEFDARKESPLERMARLSRGVRFNHFPPGELCRFYEDSHVLKQLNGGPTLVVEFQRDSKKLRYLAPSPDAGLPDGEYLLYCRPDDNSRIHITRDGAYIGTWTLESKVAPGDAIALAQAIQRKTALLNHHVGNVRRRHRAALESREADLRNNAAILQEAGLVPVNAPLEGTARFNASVHVQSHTDCGSALAQAVSVHTAKKQAAVSAAAEEKEMAALADEALLATIRPPLED